MKSGRWRSLSRFCARPGTTREMRMKKRFVVWISLHHPEVGIYKRKQESKKTKLDQESDQETRTRPRKRPRKKEKTFFFFLITFLVKFLFSYILIIFYKFPPLVWAIATRILYKYDEEMPSHFSVTSRFIFWGELRAFSRVVVTWQRILKRRQSLV